MVTAFLTFCIIAGSILKYMYPDSSSVLLTIYNVFTIVCITGVWLIIVILIFGFGCHNFINHPQFRKAYTAKAKLISVEKPVGTSSHVKLTVSFTDMNNEERQCIISSDSNKNAACFEKRGGGKIRYKIEENGVKAIIAKEYCSIGRIIFSAAAAIVPMILLIAPIIYRARSFKP